MEGFQLYVAREFGKAGCPAITNLATSFTFRKLLVYMKSLCHLLLKVTGYQVTAADLFSSPQRDFERLNDFFQLVCSYLQRAEINNFLTFKVTQSLFAQLRELLALRLLWSKPLLVAVLQVYTVIFVQFQQLDKGQQEQIQLAELTEVLRVDLIRLINEVSLTEEEEFRLF